MKKKKPTSMRAERRAGVRAAEKLARDREKLASLSPGGSPDRPIDLESASQVEPHALSTSCLRCEAPEALVEHAAVVVDGERLRVARMRCPRCGTSREVWFRIAPSRVN